MTKNTPESADEQLTVHVKLEQIPPPTEKKKTNTAGIIEITIKVIAPLITIAGLLIGVWQFTAQQTYNDKMEFKRKIWEKRLDAYSEISDLMSKIVTAKNKDKLDSLAGRFEQLYWGKLPLFEDSAVERSLKVFQEILQDTKDNIEDVDNKNLLKKAGYIAVTNCKNSIHNSWTELSK